MNKIIKFLLTGPRPREKPEMSEAERKGYEEEQGRLKAKMEYEKKQKLKEWAWGIDSW